MSISTFVDFLLSKDIPGVDTHAQYKVHIGAADPPNPEYNVSGNMDGTPEQVAAALRIAPNGPTEADYERWDKHMPAGSPCPTCGQMPPPERTVVTERDVILGRFA